MREFSGKGNKVVRKFVIIGFLSILSSMTVVSYSSWSQIKNLQWLRALVYLEDIKSNPCESQFYGYGRLYKHGCYVNPVSVVQSVDDSISRVHRGLDISEDQKYELLKAVDFLSGWAEARRYNDFYYMVAPYKFSWSKYGLEPGWVSGMAQGHIVEAMIVAYEITKNEEYLKKAKSFANAFYVPVENGGVTVWTEYGPWFEEYAQAGKKPSYALNGHIFAIEGLYRLSHYAPEYKNLVYQVVETTVGIIDKFDNGWWSRYDLRGTIANQKYHHIHIKQLHWLAVEFDNEKLDDFARSMLWSQLYPFSSVFRFLYSPTRFLGFLLVLNLLFFVMFYSVIFFALKLRKNI